MLLVGEYCGAGLSPRVRGNLPLRRPPRLRRRSIPACAGEPTTAGLRYTVRGVYPRVCGGTASAVPASGALIGLSPRVRGNRPACRTICPTGRSIPACAGEPNRRRAAKGVPRVYPRVCGGTPGRANGCLALPGLSPRVRGNPLLSASDNRGIGSIPACAGEPPSACVVQYRRRVYPRVCGGTAVAGTLDPVLNGLSPRVRGNLHRRGD